MGVCCSRMESIYHVSTISDLKVVVRNDIQFYLDQHKAILEDSVIFYLYRE